MSTTETVLLIIVAGLVAVMLSNVAFQIIAERRNPPIGVFIECDGVRLHYIDRGDAASPCVVLFHGNGTMIQDLILSGLVDSLANNYRVVCFDRPGFGYSQRPRTRVWTASAQATLFAMVLDRLGVRNPVVLGHSWGTLVAIALALKSDYAVNGLVLASGVRRTLAAMAMSTKSQISRTGSNCGSLPFEPGIAGFAPFATS